MNNKGQETPTAVQWTGIHNSERSSIDYAGSESQVRCWRARPLDRSRFWLNPAGRERAYNPSVDVSSCHSAAKSPALLFNRPELRIPKGNRAAGRRHG